MENWKDIRGYKGIYQVSNLGRVKSIGRLKFCGKNTVNGTWYKEKILKGNVDGWGYLRVNLWKANRSRMVKIHTLVADTFLPKIKKKTDVNHIDGIKTHNWLENLERCTRSENIIHAFKMGLSKPAWSGKFGKDHHRSLAVNQFDLSGKLIKKFNGQTEAQRNTGVKQGDISSVCRGKRVTAGGFKWGYA